MCKLVEDYANNVAIEREMISIKKLFENGCALDVVIASFATISEEVIRKVYEEVAMNKTLS